MFKSSWGHSVHFQFSTTMCFKKWFVVIEREFEFVVNLNSGTLVTHIWDTFDLAVLNVILCWSNDLISKWYTVQLENSWWSSGENHWKFGISTTHMGCLESLFRDHDSNSCLTKIILYRSPEPPCDQIYLGDQKINFFRFFSEPWTVTNKKKWIFF